MRIIGRPPIHPWLFALGKAAIVPHWVFLAASALGVRWTANDLPGARPIGFVLAAVGILLLVAAVRQLGASTRIGLPVESTELRTHGLYRISRNPIYLALFLSGAGSCLLAPHWFNLVSTAVMIAVHHRIVLAEERFLEGRFDQAWRDYRATVRRYL